MSPRGERRARSIYYYGTSYFNSCTNWQQLGADGRTRVWSSGKITR